MAKFKTEDVVRDEAGKILAFENTDIAIAGVGQLTTFNQLGFTKISDKPDGWYLPKNRNDVAIILETKNSNINITKDNCLDELKKNINIISTQYKKIIGILYNGYDVLVIKDSLMIDTRNTLFNKDYYLKLYNKNTIDKNLIYYLTKQINDNLHFNFGIKNLNHRMIFTACTLVAKRYNAILIKGMNWGTLHSSNFIYIAKIIRRSKKTEPKVRPCR
jgi:type I restriction enzyme M protein